VISVVLSFSEDCTSFLNFRGSKFDLRAATRFGLRQPKVITFDSSVT